MAENNDNSKQNKHDLQEILIASKTALTLRDISYQTGLDVHRILELLKTSPSIHQKVLDKLDAARAKLNNNIAENCNNTGAPSLNKKYVLDTCFILSNQDLIQKMAQEGYHFIITNVVLNELGYPKHMCNYITLQSEFFDIVLIDDTRYDYVDNMLVKYCASDIKNIGLATSDIQLSLKAKMFGIEVIYSPMSESMLSTNMSKRKNKRKKSKFKHCNDRINNSKDVNNNEANNSNINNTIENTISDIQESTLKPTETICNEAGFNEFPSTLSFIDYIDGSLKLSNFNNSIATRQVISNGKVYTDGSIDLVLGDEIYTAEYWHRKEKDFITFRHYRIISLTKTNYAQLIYSKKIDSNESDLKEYYKLFISSFKKSHNCKF